MYNTLRKIAILKYTCFILNLFQIKKKPDSPIKSDQIDEQAHCQRRNQVTNRQTAALFPE
jgi:hypothetical protein